MPRPREEDEEKKPTPKQKFLKEVADGEEKHRATAAPEEVPIDEDEKDDDEEESEPSRLEKKKNRYADLRRERDEAATKLRDEQRRADMAEMKAMSLEQYARGAQALMGSQGQKSAHDIELERLAKEQQGVINAFSARRAVLPQGQDLPAEEYDKMRAEVNRLQVQQQRAIVRHELGAQPRAATPMDAQVAAQEAMLRSKYPDIMGNPQYSTHTAHLFNAKKSAGLDDTRALEEAVGETRKAFKLKGPGPSDIEKARYAGPSTGLAGTTSSGKRAIMMSEDMKKIAIRANKGLPPEEAIRKWAKEVGPRVLEDEAKAGR
jgi:hypothetical protein